MWWLLTVLIIATGVLTYLLAAPIYFELNSVTGLCRLRFHHGACAGLSLANNSLMLDLKIGWWKKQFDLLAKGKPRGKKITSQKKKSGRRRISLKKLRGVVASFKINQFNISIDTGNPSANGILFPWFFWLGRVIRKKIQINFLNENEIIIELENNIARILWTFIIS